MQPRPFALDGSVPYRELRAPDLPEALRALALECFAAQRAAGHEQPAVAATPPGGDARASQAFPHAVSDAALEQVLATGQSIGGIVTHRELATAVPFNARNTADVLWSKTVAAQRRRLDAAVRQWIGSMFAGGPHLVLSPAGHWWYPPGTYFGWHTNHGYPGWRFYLSHAEQEGRSFFRYRDPLSGAVVTSPDSHWDLRLFDISAERDFWHAIYSETHRFSIGWYVRPWSPRVAAKAFVKSMLGR